MIEIDRVGLSKIARSSGEDCCAFIATSCQGYGCVRVSYLANSTLFDRLEFGSIKAKGEGGSTQFSWEDE